MFEKLIFVLAALTILFFFIYIFYNGNTVKSCLLFILGALPLMNLKITPEEGWGGFRTFDFICFYGLVFLYKDFATINLKKNLNLYLLLFGGLCGVLILSGLSSEFPERTWVSFFRFITIFIFGRFLVITCFKDPQFYKSIINALKISYVVALFFMCGQVIFGLGFTFYPSLGPNTVDSTLQMVRFPGIFYDAQANGQYLAMGSFLFLYVEPDSDAKVKWMNYGVFFLAMIGMVLAGSRAPIGGFILGLILLFFLLSKKYRLYGGFVVVILIAAYMVILPQGGFFKRTEDVSEDFLFRKSIWDEALTIYSENPMLGIGAGNYKDHIMRHNQNQNLEIEEGVFLYFDQPENGYLKILVEFGSVGFLFFAVMLILPLVKGIIGYYQQNFTPFIGLLMASLIVWMLAFSTVYSISDARILIMVATLIILITTTLKTNSNEFTA